MGKASSNNPPINNKVSLQNPPDNRHDTVLPLPLEVEANAVAVDAACSGNPGPMEYRGIYLRTGQQIFHFGPVQGTNNIGEFLAIVHALALLKKKKCKTTLPQTPENQPLHDMIARAEAWLLSNSYSNPIIKWETEKWGEIPADFGRK